MFRFKSLLTFITFSLLSIQSFSQEELVFATSSEPGTLQYQTSEKFTELANEKIGDAYKITFFGAAQLGKDKDLMQKIKLGTIDFTLPSSIMSSIISEYAIFDMPFIFKDRQHINRFIDEIFYNKLAPVTEAKGYKVVSVWENGFRQMTNNKKPINTPADLQGIKIRTPNSTWRVKMFKNWGGNPTPMAFSEVFVGLQTNVIDGQENPLTNIAGAKLEEVQKYLSITNHVYSPVYLVTSPKLYKSLPENVQNAIKEAADEAGQWSFVEGESQDETLLTELKNNGMEINVADREAFVMQSQSVYDEFSSEVEIGEELINDVKSLVQ